MMLALLRRKLTTAVNSPLSRQSAYGLNPLSDTRNRRSSQREIQCGPLPTNWIPRAPYLMTYLTLSSVYDDSR